MSELKRYMVPDGHGVEAHSAGLLYLKADADEVIDALRAAIKRQAGAAKTLRQLTLDEVQHLKDADRTNHIAPSVIQGEREANAILSADNEALRAQLAAAQAQVADMRETLQLGVSLVDQDELSDRAGWDCFYAHTDRAIRALTQTTEPRPDAAKEE